VKTSITYNNFEYAYSQTLPEYGEGWGDYSEILRKKMQEVSNLIEHCNMVADLVKPGGDIISDMSGEAAAKLHMAIGISGECGELADAINYASITKTKVDEENVIEEIGDILFYVEGALYELDMSSFYFEGTEVVATYEDLYAESGCKYYKAHKDGLTQSNPMCIFDIMSVKAGDFLDLVKKHAIYAKELDERKYTETLCGVRYFLGIFCAYCGYSIDKCREANMMKLLKGDKARYKDGKYSNEAAQNRADKK